MFCSQELSTSPLLSASFPSAIISSGQCKSFALKEINNVGKPSYLIMANTSFFWCSRYWDEFWIALNIHKTFTDVVIQDVTSGVTLSLSFTYSNSEVDSVAHLFCSVISSFCKICSEYEERVFYQHIVDPIYKYHNIKQACVFFVFSTRVWPQNTDENAKYWEFGSLKILISLWSSPSATDKTVL